MSLKQYGFKDSMCINSEGTIARISAVHRDRFEFISDIGTGFAVLKKGNFFDGKENYPTVGDFVVITYNKSGDSIITKTLERRTYFKRMDPSYSGYREQAIASNFDFVFIVQSLNEDLNIRRLERYLTLAWDSGASPIIVLTKKDIATNLNEDLSLVIGNASGAPVFSISSSTGEGIDEIMKIVKAGDTIVLLGSSGVGKSSLVNAIEGKSLMKVNTIRENDSKGRHTTTHRQLIKLSSGIIVIDTPGMRELGMFGVGEGLGGAFKDIELFAQMCKFNDCSHENEPGCAVLKAIAERSITKEKLQSYKKLLKEVEYSEKKEIARQKKKEWGKAITKYQKTRHKIKY